MGSPVGERRRRGRWFRQDSTRGSGLATWCDADLRRPRTCFAISVCSTCSARVTAKRSACDWKATPSPPVSLPGIPANAGETPASAAARASAASDVSMLAPASRAAKPGGSCSPSARADRAGGGVGSSREWRSARRTLPVRGALLSRSAKLRVRLPPGRCHCRVALAIVFCVRGEPPLTRPPSRGAASYERSRLLSWCNVS